MNKDFKLLKDSIISLCELQDLKKLDPFIDELLQLVIRKPSVIITIKLRNRLFLNSLYKCYRTDNHFSKNIEKFIFCFYKALTDLKFNVVDNYDVFNNFFNWAKINEEMRQINPEFQITYLTSANYTFINAFETLISNNDEIRHLYFNKLNNGFFPLEKNYCKKLKKIKI